jgi:histidinol-phosphatase (PHP family)
MSPTPSKPWLVSLHGGHSGSYCDHAEDTLEALVQAAVQRGMSTYGLTEHAPRVEPELVYAEEKAMGWDVAHLRTLFDDYVTEARRLQAAYAAEIELLVGFEAEVVPADRYATVMQEFRDQYALDYIVGSVHWVDGIIIDYTKTWFDAAVEACGGLEGLALRYYELVAEMIVALRPEVLGHLDLIRRHGGEAPEFETAAVQDRVRQVLALMNEHETILDINTAAYRKGLATPYPAPWLLKAARDQGVACCFGDDAHRISEIGAGIPEAREYLLHHGVARVTVLTREKSGTGRREVAL